MSWASCSGTQPAWVVLLFVYVVVQPHLADFADSTAELKLAPDA